MLCSKQKGRRCFFLLVCFCLFDACCFEFFEDLCDFRPGQEGTLFCLNAFLPNVFSPG